jgi:hypothetical protein
MRSRDHNVVVVRHTIKPGMLGIWNGEGMGRGWEGGGQFTSSLGPRWTGSYHDKEGFQVSKRQTGLKKEELARGEKTRGLRHNCAYNCVRVYNNNCPNVECS